jgi:hypothetical protein
MMGYRFTSPNAAVRLWFRAGREINPELRQGFLPPVMTGKIAVGQQFTDDRSSAPADFGREWNR